MTDEATLEKERAVARLVVNRPDKHNALSFAGLVQMVQMLDRDWVGPATPGSGLRRCSCIDRKRPASCCCSPRSSMDGLRPNLDWLTVLFQRMNSKLRSNHGRKGLRSPPRMPL